VNLLACRNTAGAAHRTLVLDRLQLGDHQHDLVGHLLIDPLASRSGARLGFPAQLRPTIYGKGAACRVGSAGEVKAGDGAISVTSK